MKLQFTSSIFTLLLAIIASTNINLVHANTESTNKASIEGILLKENSDDSSSRAKIKVNKTKIGRATVCLDKDKEIIANNDNKNTKDVFYIKKIDEIRLKDQLRKGMVKNNISSETINKIIDSVKAVESATKSSNNQPEVKNDFQTYYNRYRVEDLAKTGKIYDSLYNKQFEKIYKIFNVDSSVILALSGVESRFGKSLGSFNALDALYTRIIDLHNSKSQDFYINNFIILAKLIDNEILPFNVKSSWAGAIGQCQFMPSSIYQYGISIINKKLDIVNDKNDVFSSVANYLYNKGWNPNLGVATEIELPEDFDNCLIGLYNTKTIKEWKSLGIKIIDKNPISKEYTANEDLLVSIIVPDINDNSILNKRAFIVYDNFTVLLTYNMSIKYALAVGILRDLIENSK